jgi:hypothetical protein
LEPNPVARRPVTVFFCRQIRHDRSVFYKGTRIVASIEELIRVKETPGLMIY